MSDGKKYEDWLRGCVHHDGRHGYVTLPCDEVLKIADFIERLRADHKDEPTISKMEQVDKDINVRSKDKPRAEGVWNAGYKTGYDKGYKDAQKVKDSQDLVKDLVKAFCEDGTWLERQGVYTLTLAEAKQRAVDIIESVLAKDEPQKKEVEWVYNKRERLWYPYSNGELLFKTENSSEKPNNCECEPRKEQNFCGKCRYLYRDFKYGLSCYRLMDNEPCKYEERKDEPRTDWKDEMWAEAVEDEPQTEDTCEGCIHDNDDDLIICLACVFGTDKKERSSE